MHLKQLADNYIRFNNWANQRMVRWLEQAPVDKLYEKVPSSFPSIDTTLQHVLRTQRFWHLFILERDYSKLNWNVRENEAPQILRELEDVSIRMEADFLTLTEDALTKKLVLDMPWAKNSLCRYEYIQHIVNHGTFHRGQVVTIARSVGLTSGVPNTDYNIFRCP